MVTLFSYKKEEHSLRIETSQLTPGCILSKSVFGKTKYPIIDKDTVITQDHIDFLHSFFIETVNVSRKLNNGQPFVVSKNAVKKSNTNHAFNKTKETKETKESFVIHYKRVKTSYERIFKSWGNSMPVDMPDLRKLLIPLIEWIEIDNFDIYHLHSYSTKENYMYSHDLAVSILSAFLAKEMGYKKGEWIQIGLAGFLSNCGMSQIEMNTLKKATYLSHIEQEKIRKHPVYSYRMIESIRTITDAVKLAVVQHHERLDGSGYPLALKKSKIHKYARIIAVSDTYLAMTSERFYQKKQAPQIVLEKLQKEQALKLDPKVVQVLVNHFQD